MKLSKHLMRVWEVQHDLNDYLAYAKCYEEYWYDLGHSDQFDDEDTEEQVIDAWEHWLEMANEYEKEAIALANRIQRTFGAMA